MKEELIKFTEDFFKSQNSNISFANEIMAVEKIPADFQAFYGKKEPYLFVFEDIHNKENITEVIKPGCFIIGRIKEYLKTKGQTTLINLQFNLEPRDILAKFFAFKNCELSNLNKKEIQDFLLRFSFQTNFQYQNQREQESYTINVYKNNIVNFNLEDYKYGEGKNKNIPIDSLKKDYDLAKAEIKGIIQPKIEKLGAELDIKLEKELKRINEHFSNQLKEVETKIKGLETDIIRLENNKTPDENTSQRIIKAKALLGELQQGALFDKIKKEQDFFINDEKHKHSLNLSTKLINTTIVSYPIFIITGYLKNRDTARVLELTYNPLLEKMQELFCDSCKTPLHILSLCSSGHLVCDKCLRGCSGCGKDYCTNCMNKSCFSCGKKLCKKCLKRCSKCLKDKCAEHMSKFNVCLTCEEKSSKPKISFY